MNMASEKRTNTTAERRNAWEALVAADAHATFGPIFFLRHLRGLVRDQCPDPSEGMPRVVLHLVDGAELDVCHVIGIDARWIALAVREPEQEGRLLAMRTELVPYPMIVRIVIYAVRKEFSHHVGFDVARYPRLVGEEPGDGTMTPEEALKAVAGMAGSASTQDSPPAEQEGDPSGPPGRAGHSRRTQG